MEKRYLTIQIKGTRFSTRPKRNSTKRVAFVAVIPSRLRENVDLFLLLNSYMVDSRDRIGTLRGSLFFSWKII